MRILMVTTSMTTGGIQSVVRDLSEQLVLRGHVVGVISLCGHDNVATRPAVHRWSLGLEGLASNVRTAIRGVREVIATFRPDVVHSHAFHANLVAELATFGSHGPPCIRTIHSVREGGIIHRVISRGMELSGPPSVAVSRAVASAHGLSDRSEIHYNAIDLERFAFNANERTRVRRELSLGSGDVLALSVGRLTPAKDFRTLVAAAATVFGRQPGLHLAIAGEGPQRAELSALIDASGYASRISLLGQRSDVPSLLSAADVYVQASAWEGFPLAPIEAMASGLQVLATDVGGTRELRPRPVRLLKAGDVLGIGRALEDSAQFLRSDSERMESVSMLEHYALGKWTMDWVAEYRRARAR